MNYSFFCRFYVEWICVSTLWALTCPCAMRVIVFFAQWLLDGVNVVKPVCPFNVVVRNWMPVRNVVLDKQTTCNLVSEKKI